MQPGDTIQPTIRIANLGPAYRDAGAGQVDLVASTTRSSPREARSWRPTPSPTSRDVGSLLGDADLRRHQPRPAEQHRHDHRCGGHAADRRRRSTSSAWSSTRTTRSSRSRVSAGPAASSNALSLPQQVGPPIKGLPPAGVVYARWRRQQPPVPLSAQRHPARRPRDPPDGRHALRSDRTIRDDEAVRARRLRPGTSRALARRRARPDRRVVRLP